MPNCKRGSKEHLKTILETIGDSLKNLNERSEENARDVVVIKNAVYDMYAEYASRWAAMNENN